MLPSGDLWPHNGHHHRPSLPHSLRCWVPHGHTSLAPACGYTALALPLISRTCTLVQHDREHYPYSPAGQLGKSTPRGQPQSMPPRPANGSSLPVTHFQCYLVTHPLLPSLPLGPTPRGHGYLIPQAMWWPLASSVHWSLRLLYLLGILLTVPVVLLFTLFAEPRVGKIKENFQQAGKLEENSRNCRNCMFILSTLVQQPMQQICYILLWLTQQTQP